MSEKAELVSYLTGLLALMESREDAALTRGRTLGREYERGYVRLIQIIRSEEDETRKRENNESRKGSVRDETGKSESGGTNGNRSGPTAVDAEGES
jgi:hypothetical protein